MRKCFLKKDKLKYFIWRLFFELTFTGLRNTAEMKEKWAFAVSEFNNEGFINMSGGQR